MEMSFFLAFDLGAESGRTLLGRLDKGRLFARELTRFPNAPVRVLGHLHWDIHGLLEEIKKGIREGLAESGNGLTSLAVDTWGVDYGLLAPDGTVLGLPLAYRDSQFQGAMEEFFGVFPREQIYERTGIQFLPFNTLFQLFAASRRSPGLIARAGALLFMPDLFSYLLTGRKAAEYTIASTSQMLDARSRTWDGALLSAAGVPPSLMQEIIAPGTLLGFLSPEVLGETGFPKIPVVATAGHDTAAAIAAVPAAGEDWAYISSGTWSLMGVELRAPLIDSAALAANFTNEGGVSGRVRFLKNIAGLWLLQQCRKEWSAGRALDYDELARLAAEAPAFEAFVDPDSRDFLNPSSMPDAVAAYCRRTGQRPPSSIGATVRAILESLALKYRGTLDELRRLTEKPIGRIHVIGGGSRNGRLCQFTADATGLPVLAGPAEATAMGNLMIQAMAAGQVGSLEEVRSIVRESVELKEYEPDQPAVWDRAYARFREVVGF
jgi:rhamnulokinase